MRLYACLCVCAWLFLVHGSILFLSNKARREYCLDSSMLELILWVRYSGVRLHWKPASLSNLCLPFSSPHVSGAKMCCFFFFWLTVLHTGSPRKRVAVTELSQGCHRWFCAKSAVSVDASLEEGWGGWKLCSCHPRDSPCVLVSKGGPWQRPLLPHVASAFLGLHLESTEDSGRLDGLGEAGLPKIRNSLMTLCIKACSGI